MRTCRRRSSPLPAAGTVAAGLGLPLCLPLCILAALFAGAGSPVPVRAADLLPPERPIEEVVDFYIDAKLAKAGVTPAPPADDAVFIRRVMLDLAGRIPTAAEARAYVESADPHKRVKLVDELLASPEFARYQAYELDAMLMAGTRGSIREYLLAAAGENRPWDQMFRELVLPNEEDASLKGANAFLAQRVGDLDKLTTDVSVLFLGVNISCARCHDHPLTPAWTQDHFFGMKSFFARTFDNGGFIAEREYGNVDFKTTKGESRSARLMFLSGDVLDEPSSAEPSEAEKKKEKDLLEQFKRDKKAPPPPGYSRRARLVEVALGPEGSDFFPRSIVNRAWHRLFGWGLVMPLDQMHEDNPSSHDDLLSWLARDTVAHRYDLKRLVRGLVLSRAYGRSSRWEGGKRPLSSLFAVAAARPLKPQQYAMALRMASLSPDALPADMKPQDFSDRIASLERAASGLAAQIEMPGEDFQISVDEALLFSNSDQFARDYLRDAGDSLVGKLKTIDDPEEFVQTAYWSVLSRPADEEEGAALASYLAERSDRRAEAARQIVWALLAGGEFRFNH
jgi:hypothetical protein